MVRKPLILAVVCLPKAAATCAPPHVPPCGNLGQQVEGVQDAIPGAPQSFAAELPPPVDELPPDVFPLFVCMFVSRRVCRIVRVCVVCLVCLCGSCSVCCVLRVACSNTLLVICIIISSSIIMSIELISNRQQ